MIQQICAELIRLGYQFLKVKPDEAGIYYKLEGNHAVVIVTVYYHKGFQLTPSQAKSIQLKTMELFLTSERIPEITEGEDSQIEELVLLVAEHMDGIREICAQNTNTWALDSRTGKLILYENQPNDFYGLREYIETISVTAYKEDRADKAKHRHQTGQNRKNWKVQPVMTEALVVINCIVWFILELMGDTREGMFMLFHGAMYPDCLFGAGEWWRLITAMFLHFGLEHLLNNMVILSVTGYRLEHALGHVRFALLYLLSGIAGNLVSYIIMDYTGEQAVSAGASGAVFGVIGGLLFVAIKNKGHIGDLTTRGLLLMIALCLYYGFTAEGVDNYCHMGGLIGGFVLGIVFSLGIKINRRKTSGKD